MSDSDPLDAFSDKLIPEQEMLTNLAYWFPILDTIGMRVPKTIIIHRGNCEISGIMEGEELDCIRMFIKHILEAMDEIGYPCFFRTGMLSDKFSWKDTCFVEKKPTIKELNARIGRLIETSHMANIAGRPVNYDYWAVREMIPTSPVVHYFNDMPIAMEARAFINNGKIQCIHPYWVEDSFKNAEEDVIEKAKTLQSIPKHLQKELIQMVNYIAKYFKGYWSVDMLLDRDEQWWCTDMAVGERSYHLPTCDHA